MSTLPDERLVQRLRAEYIEMPGMKLTIEQVRRLCGIEETICRTVLESLVQTRFLFLRADGTYVRVTEGSPAQSRPAKATLERSRPPAWSRRAS